MSISAETVRRMNADSAQLRLSDTRMAEVAIELEQLRIAIESVRHKVEFDRNPWDFKAAICDRFLSEGRS